MKVGDVRQLVIRAILVPGLLVIWGCDKSMELQEITQCISPAGGGVEATPPRGLALIPAKQCYGLYWSIPLAYEPYLFGTPVENLNITMGLLDQTPGAHMTDVRKAREQPEIAVYPQVGNGFQQRIAEVRKTAEETYGLKPTAGSMYGMEVLMSDASSAGAKMVMFYPVTQDGAMVVCTIGAGQDATQIDPLTLCSVTTYMNEWLYAEYNILYSLMPQFELINAVMVNNILEFETRAPAA
jgi:hypothetical protein